MPIETPIESVCLLPSGQKHTVIVRVGGQYFDRGISVDLDRATNLASKIRDVGKVDLALWKPVGGSNPAPAALPPGFESTPEPQPTAQAVAATRIERVTSELSKLGFAVPPPIFAAGTQVYPSAHGRLREVRRKLVAEGETLSNAMDLAQRVTDEERRDFVVPKKTLLLVDGRLEGGAPSLKVEEEGLAQLFSALGYPSASTVRGILPLHSQATLGTMFQEVAQSSTGEVMLRCRQSPSGVGSLYGAVGPRYPGRVSADCLDADRVIPRFARHLEELERRTEQTFHGKAAYDPISTKWSVDAGWMAESIPTFAAGDITQLRLRFTGHDGGGGAVRGTLIIENNRCLNYIIVGTATLQPLRVPHVGDTTGKLQAQLTSYFSKAHEAARVVVGAYGRLQETKATDFYGVDTIDSALEKLVDTELPTKAGIKRDALVEALLTNWKDFGSHNNVAALVDSVTRLHTRVPIPVADELSAWAGDYLPKAAEMTYSA